MESLSAGWRYDGTSGAGVEDIYCWAGHEKNTIYAVGVRVGRVLSFLLQTNLFIIALIAFLHKFRLRKCF